MQRMDSIIKTTIVLLNSIVKYFSNKDVVKVSKVNFLSALAL
jgi:hypothetical protein